ncbi:multicomponent Na+:H+ antiporter subunit E [Phyllobacterium trifolii]|jgi:multicomponent Na+:H+ antiporter subunit E|uniref:Multicomponent Na+:H+ antiporter subunit E n=1 Tax=Phyllobacterium trifolii TaxID=300193 RepID=A0A839UFU0_9HYPH|nr:Na+/H+ antiporter subunit E [Phyllobacterium trifolii]MBB3149427.1 multicomponent Na+:H+ antiporter subunit E [Phyllobacterium trifolii]
MPSDRQTDDSSVSRSALGSISLWLLLFSLWLILNSSLALPIVVTGAVIALVVDWIFMRRSGTWWNVLLTPRSVLHFIAYTGVFFLELVKANLNMLRYVYSPRIDIHPGIVRINIRLKSPIGRLALANSIALTPGSLVMAIKDDALFIHWLDVKTVDPEIATEMIAGPFEKHLGEVFG